MKKRIILSELSQRQLTEITIWYNSRRAGLGPVFLASLDRIMERISKFPAQFPISYRDYRQALMDRFPYRIFYREEQQEIQILAVLHVSRDHDPFLKRIQ
ncbi:MAG: type II toxin-antitoxin system RelE/ParE family toxin [bacterium]|nr:type II toxin-antitoxin system RelE/ParE family toxin [bacterium]